MRGLKLVIIIIIATSLILSCRNSDSFQNVTLPQDLWSSNDSLAFYFPQSDNPDSGFLNTKGDNFREKWYSSALYSFREPVLYDKNLQTNIYRFLWLRSFHRPVVFVLSKFENKVTLTTKILNQQPEFLEHRYDPRGWDGWEEELKGKTIERFGDSLIVAKADRKADIVYNNTKEVTSKDWETFEELLQKENFWKMPANRDDERGMDGSEWIIEGRLKDKYWFAARWSPHNNNFQNAGILLIKLSGLKEQIY